jgi:general secretion pathway protein E
MMTAVRFDVKMPVSFALAPRVEIEKTLKKYYGVGAETLDEMGKDEPMDLEIASDKEITEGDQEASVIKFVNQIIWEAFKNRATDIHFEPQEDELRIRNRIDGILYQIPLPPQLKRFQSAIISRIKVMSGMNISEKRLPQDGRINVRIKGEEIDIRVSTVPTVYGESVSLRLLIRGKIFLSLDKLGFSAQEESAIREIIIKPHGIFLVTGPTGAGKSTSLYAFLSAINSISKRIITVEEPVEYELKGINQIAVRSDIGLTFAMGLRHILRQDPNVVMVGEIRDQETADIAIRASLTGHLVFSTLHTNDAASAFTRLTDMGIEPFLIASSVEAVMAQRLVRTICPTCKTEQKVNHGLPAQNRLSGKRDWHGEILARGGLRELPAAGLQGPQGHLRTPRRHRGAAHAHHEPGTGHHHRAARHRTRDAHAPHGRLAQGERRHHHHRRSAAGHADGGAPGRPPQTRGRRLIPPALTP